MSGGPTFWSSLVFGADFGIKQCQRDEILNLQSIWYMVYHAKLT